MDQRSGDGCISGQSQDCAVNWRVSFTEFEMLDAKIASALKKIITNPYFKKKVSLEEQKARMEDRFLSGRQIAFMIYEYFRVTGAHGAVLDSFILFSVVLLDMATIFRILTPDGIKLQNLRKNHPKIVFWKVCIRCEYESLCSSRQYWRCIKKKSFKINRSRVSRS